jgi:hypothetical protein
MAGSHVAMPGNRQQSTTAMNIRATKGIVPKMMSDNGMSGAIFLMTRY